MDLSTENELELEIWKGDIGLPSIDPHCLAVMAYCKFASVPIKISATNSIWRSPSGDLPVLRHGPTITLTKLNDIFDHLRSNNMGTDFDLNGKQSADILAFTSLIEEKLVPALLHLYWINTKTYAEYTWPWFVNNLSFPFNYYVPMQKHMAVKKRLSQTHCIEHTTDSISEHEAQMYGEAKECLTILSTKLADKDYFFGKRASSLDAVIFGFLTPLLKSELYNNPLQNHLKCCTNLCSFCNRILDKYFPDVVQESQSEQRKSKMASTDAGEFPNQKRNMIVSGLVALTAMVGYALMSGLVQIDIGSSDKDQEYLKPRKNMLHQFDRINTREHRDEKHEGNKH